MGKPLTVIIVTLSVVCTLKGVCQHTLFDLGVLRYMNTRDQSNVKGIKDILQISRLYMLCMSEMSEMVFAAFTQMYTDTQCTAYMPLTPLGGRVLLRGPRSVGLAVHNHAVQGGSFVTFFGLVKLQG